MNRTIILRTVAAVIVATSLGVGGWAWGRDSASKQEHPTVPQLIESLKPQLNDEQQKSLADGVLTRAEYDAALDRVAACIESDGQTVHRVPGRGPGGVDEIWSEWPDSAPFHREAVLACHEKHIGKLSMIWAEQNRPTPEQLVDHAKAVDACLVANGAAHVAGKPLEAIWDISADRNAYAECLGEVPPAGAASKSQGSRRAP